MFRTIADFADVWASETNATLKILNTLTDESLGQPIDGESRTLGRLAWHITLSLGEMVSRMGVPVQGPAEETPPPASVAAIVSAFETAALSVLEEIRKHWTDATLTQEDDMYGETWARGYTLLAVVLHQAHHRGQMTVLMRQAGLVVPGIYGPAREEWRSFGMPAPSI